MILVRTRTSEIDLHAIADHIALDDPRAVLRFIQGLRRRSEMLLDNPRAFPLIPNYEAFGVRRRPWRGYLIFFRVEDDCVTILRVLHGARDYEPLLFPES